MSDSVLIVFATLLLGLIVSIFGFVLSRAVGNVDRNLLDLGAKIDTLTAADSRFAVELTELRARVLSLEHAFRKFTKES